MCLHKHIQCAEQNEFMPAELMLSPEAVRLIKNFALHFGIHDLCVSVVENYPRWDNSGLDTEFECKLAGYVRHSISMFLLVEEHVDVICICEEPVLDELRQLLIDVIDIGFMRIPTENEVSRLVDKYPTAVLGRVCRSYPGHAHVVGESVRRFIETTDFDVVPMSVYMSMEGRYPLTGTPQSPLTNLELQAIQTYLRTRKHRHVHLLLNCLHQFERDIAKIYGDDDFSQEDMIQIAQSAWFPLHLFAAVRHAELGYHQADMLDVSI